MKGGLLQSIIALVGGFAIMVFLTIALTIAQVAVFGVRAGEPAPGYLAVGLCLSAFAALVGGYSTAALAPHRPRAHTIGLAVMVFAMALSSVAGPHAAQPDWYPWALVVIGPSLSLAGGLLRRPRGTPSTR